MIPLPDMPPKLTMERYYAMSFEAMDEFDRWYRAQTGRPIVDDVITELTYIPANIDNGRLRPILRIVRIIVPTRADPITEVEHIPLRAVVP